MGARRANIDFVNTWTKLHGNHTFKFGADVRRIRDALLQGQTFSPRGLAAGVFSDSSSTFATAQENRR